MSYPFETLKFGISNNEIFIEHNMLGIENKLNILDTRVISVKFSVIEGYIVFNVF